MSPPLTREEVRNFPTLCKGSRGYGGAEETTPEEEEVDRGVSSSHPWSFRSPIVRYLREK